LSEFLGPQIYTLTTGKNEKETGRPVHDNRFAAVVRRLVVVRHDKNVAVSPRDEACRLRPEFDRSKYVITPVDDVFTRRRATAKTVE